MKKIILAIAAVGVMSTPAFAQTAEYGRSAATAEQRATTDVMPRQRIDGATQAPRSTENKQTLSGGQPGGDTLTGR